MVKLSGSQDKYRMKTFAQFLTEKEKMIKMFGAAQIKRSVGVVNPAKPVFKPFSGISVTKDYAKDGPARAPRGVMGR